jgi:hypothetical protein
MDCYDELACLMIEYCEQRQLDLSGYVDGMTNGGLISPDIAATLIRYHKEWLK